MREILFPLMLAALCVWPIFASEKRLWRILPSLVVVALIHPWLMGLFFWRAAQPASDSVPPEMTDFIMIGLYIAAAILAFGVLFHEFGVRDAASHSRSRSLVDCIYFSTITWTTVGYGDFVPDSRVSRLIAAYEALLGYLTMASLVAAIVSMLTPNPNHALR